MPRLLAIVILVAATACHPTSMLKGRVQSIGARFGGVAKIVTPKLGVNLDNVDVQAVTAIVVQAHADNASAGQPIAYTKTVDSGSYTAPAPSSPAPTVTVHRTVAPPAVFVMHGQTRGGHNSCKTYTSMEQCTSECTNSLKAGSMTRDPNAAASCSCLELAGC